MYDTKAVLFEHTKILGSKLVILFMLWMMLPILCLLFITMDFNKVFMLISIVALILWFPSFIFIIIYYISKVKKVYKRFLGCNNKYRHNIDITLDFSKKSGAVLCKINSGKFSSDYFTKIIGIQYDYENNILILNWKSKIYLVPGGRNIVRATYDIGIIAIDSKDAVNILEQMKANNVKNIKKFDSEMGSYVVMALNEQ